jgi:hypothetical protein
MEEENKETKERKPFKEKFKDNWNKTDEHCVNCGAVTKQAKGLNRQNMKRLFMTMPSASEWLTLFIIVMVIFISWSYARDVKTCRDYANNIDQICMQRQEVLRQQAAYGSYILNSSNGSKNPIPDLYLPSGTNLSEANATNEINGTSVNDSNVAVNQTVS